MKKSQKNPVTLCIPNTYTSNPKFTRFPYFQKIVLAKKTHQALQSDSFLATSNGNYCCLPTYILRDYCCLTEY